MTAIQYFTPAVLQSPATLTQFLSGTRSIENLSNQRNIPFPPPPSYWHRRLICVLDVIAILPLRVIYISFLIVVAAVAHLFGFAHTAKSLEMRVLYHLKNPQLLRDYILVPSRNMPQVDTEDIYSQEDLAVDASTNPSLHHLITDIFSKDLPDQCSEMSRQAALKRLQCLEFFHDKGACNGISLWFIFLYLKTKHLFQDPVSHLCHIASHFTEGAPREASLLQTLFPTGNLYGLNTLTRLRKGDTVWIEEPPSADLFGRSQRESLLLPPGIYRLGIIGSSMGHSMVFIKPDENSSFLFNPSTGLSSCQGTHHLAEELKQTREVLKSDSKNANNGFSVMFTEILSPLSF